MHYFVGHDHFGNADIWVGPNGVSEVGAIDLNRLCSPVNPGYLISASFFRSTRLTQSCNSFGSRFCSSI